MNDALAIGASTSCRRNPSRPREIAEPALLEPKFPQIPAEVIPTPMREVRGRTPGTLRPSAQRPWCAGDLSKSPRASRP